MDEYVESLNHRHVWTLMTEDENHVPIEGCGCGLLRLAMEGTDA